MLNPQQNTHHLDPTKGIHWSFKNKMENTPSTSADQRQMFTAHKQDGKHYAIFIQLKADIDGEQDGVPTASIQLKAA